MSARDAPSYAPTALLAPHNLVTRSEESSPSPTDRAGSPGFDSPAGPQRPRSRARHGRGAFTTESRGGLSQWSGGRLGRFAQWLGPSMATVAETLDAGADIELEHLDSSLLALDGLGTSLPTCSQRSSLPIVRGSSRPTPQTPLRTSSDLAGRPDRATVASRARPRRASARRPPRRRPERSPPGRRRSSIRSSAPRRPGRPTTSTAPA